MARMGCCLSFQFSGNLKSLFKEECLDVSHFIIVVVMMGLGWMGHGDKGG